MYLGQPSRQRFGPVSVVLTFHKEGANIFFYFTDVCVSHHIITWIYTEGMMKEVANYIGKIKWINIFDRRLKLYTDWDELLAILDHLLKGEGRSVE